jgi:hypothetical protein
MGSAKKKEGLRGYGPFPLLRSKQGLSKKVLLILGELLIVLAIYAIIQGYITSVKENTLFERYYLSRDLAFLTQTIEASPGQVRYSYENGNLDMAKFAIEFKDGAVSIRERNQPAGSATVIPYAEDTSITLKGGRPQGKGITFIYSKESLEIT